MQSLISQIIFFAVGCLMAIEAVGQRDAFVFVSSTGDQSVAGISIYRLDGETGTLSLQLQDRTISQSGYLSLDPSGKYLYAIDGKFIYAFKLSQDAARLGYLNKEAIVGRGPCHISVSYGGDMAFIANYGGGQALCYRIESDGSIGGLLDSVQHGVSSGIDARRQDGPHPHMAYVTPDPARLLVPDLGADHIYIYDIDQPSGRLVASKKKGISPPGSGPRHFALHPNQKFGYVLNELAGSVTMFRYAKKNGKLKAKQTITTLNKQNKATNKSADIHITPNGQFLYASNRGPNTIAAFEIDQKKGFLTSRGDFSCGGAWPRAFGIDPSGNFLVVANKESNNLSVFRINYETGLAEKVHEVTVSAPQCVKFKKV